MDAWKSIVSFIDHAVLNPTATDTDVAAACAICTELSVASICVRPSQIGVAARLIGGSRVALSTVVGFPHGSNSTETKVAETHDSCVKGVLEIDMVVNLGKVYSGDWGYVESDIRAVVDAAREHGAITKVIFETGLLPDDEAKVRLCHLCEAAGAAFVKTSTGFGYVKGEGGALTATGATEHDIRLMRANCGPEVQVKASGGIRDYATACRFVELGATRLGTSATREIAAGECGAAKVSTTSY
jgi:deoxyribose-phosphate aldolase